MHILKNKIINHQVRLLEDDEIRALQLELLQIVHSFCLEHNIKYSLYGGTLIGAIRHQGFIPWDDDVDLVMKRDEYERFLSLFQSDVAYISMNKKGLSSNYAKICYRNTYVIEKSFSQKTINGVFIDLMPFDYLSDDYSKAQRTLNRAVKNSELLLRLEAGYPLKKRIIELDNNEKVSLLRRLLVWGKYITYLLKAPFFRPHGFVKRNRKNYPTKYSQDISVVFWKVNPIESKIMDNYVLITFENDKFMIVEDYDTFLKAFYGNYMELPPIEKRVSSHSFIVYKDI